MTSTSSPVAGELEELRLDELYEFLRIPSVSADPACAQDVHTACRWVVSAVEALGGASAIVPTHAHPLVVGEVRASKPFAEEAPTVLVYGHVDVQAPGSDDAWESPPFEPTVRDGWLYARGAADDKGNLFMLLRGLEQLVASNDLPVNVRILCDAEEEILGTSVVDFIAADSEPADACVIFDGPMPRRGQPAFYIGTRGLAYFHLRLSAGDHDLHSGLFGGAALNASHALLRVIAQIFDTPSELRRGAIEPTAAELGSWANLDAGDVVLAREGAVPADASAGSEFYERTLAMPAVEIAGFASGEPFLQKNVMPAVAEANVQIRLAPGQDVEQVSSTFEDLLRAAAPAGTSLDIERWASAPGALIDADAPALGLAREAFSSVLGVSPLLVRSGGTLPILGALADRGIPTVLTGFDLPEGNIHAPNERLLLEYLPLGVTAARETLRAFGALKATNNAL
jgi:acetylornithine deacetylase/succinyl-diaminopimelate desuccinylase-like protein